MFLSFFTHPPHSEIYTLSLHDALPISAWYRAANDTVGMPHRSKFSTPAEYHSTLFHELAHSTGHKSRSEEHTSELQSRPHLVCRLLLEKKKKSLTRFKVHAFSYTPHH